MIHVFHTPAAVLARRREQLARRCLAAVVLPGLGLMLWAATIPIIEMRGQADCDFVGVAFVEPREAPPARRRQQLPAPRLPSLQPAALPLALAEATLPATELPEIGHFELCDEFDTPADALLAMLSHPASAAAAPPPAAEADGNYTPPAYLDCPQPPYPPRLRQRRTRGTVGLTISIAADGSPTAVQVTSSSGSAALDSHTCRWVMQHWRFSPARRGNSLVAARVTTSITFALHS